VEPAALDMAFARMGMDCSRCHGKYRDVLAAPK
jgi:hypothetical protein